MGYIGTMFDILEELKKVREKTKDRLVQRRLDMADQDGRNVSRYITSTRWMVEQEIEGLDREIQRIEEGIREVSRLLKNEKRWIGKYFVTDEFEYIELGIISRKSPAGRKMFDNLDGET
jgi:hypothetical protein